MSRKERTKRGIWFVGCSSGFVPYVPPGPTKEPPPTLYRIVAGAAEEAR